jgi:hypothetical protein
MYLTPVTFVISSKLGGSKAFTPNRNFLNWELFALLLEPWNIGIFKRRSGKRKECNNWPSSFGPNVPSFHFSNIPLAKLTQGEGSHEIRQKSLR